MKSTLQFHVTLKEDHKASLEPNELTILVENQNIKWHLEIWKIYQAGNEQRTLLEKAFAENIKIGDTFHTKYLIKRPGTGIAYKIFNLIGKHSKNLYSCGDLINE